MKTATYKNEDYTGKQLAEYTVLGYDRTVKYHKQTKDYWFVRCSCGKESSVQKWKLISGSQVGCRYCSRKRFSGTNSKLWHSEYKHVTGMFFRRVECSGKKRKLEVNVTREYLDELFINQNGKCAYTNADLSFTHGSKRGNASLDRIDSSKGYVKGNVQFVESKVNNMKWDLTHQEFIEFCHTVSRNFSEKK